MRKPTNNPITQGRDTDGKFVRNFTYFDDPELSCQQKLTRYLVDRVSIVNDCWEWQGKTYKGYAYARNPFDMSNKRMHILAYEVFKNPVPDGLVLDHLCRNRKCLNPDHLEEVTLVENVMRGESEHAKNARKTHCKHGHAFSKENIYRYDNKRICRECRKINNRRHYASRNE